MKIALVQLDAHKDSWVIDAIPTYLEAAAGADLVVFPECMPFFASRNAFPKVPDAEAALIEQSRKSDGTAFVGGGYVLEGTSKRNAVFLVHEGEVKGRYFKRVRAPRERIAAAEATKTECFRWADFSFVPLICADAYDDPGPRRTTMMYGAIEAGAGGHTPIVVCSYGGELRQRGWRTSLTDWSIACAAPVAICGFSGSDGQQGYGGGGSGVFWPDGSRTEQPTAHGIYMVDTGRRTKRMARRLMPLTRTK